MLAIIKIIPSAIDPYLWTIPPPYEGFFQINPKYKLATPTAKNKKLYSIFSFI